MFLKKKFYGFVLLVILLSFSSLFANSIQGQAARGEDFASDRILIKFTENVIDQVSIENERQINVEEIDQLNVQYNVRSVEKAYIEVNNKQMDEQFGIFRWYVFKYESPIDVELLISQLKELPYIEEAIPDYIAYPAAVPNDPIYSSQWGHNNTSQMLSYNTSSGSHNGPTVGTVGFDTNAESGWDGSQGYGSSSVIIAIIDSGVDAAHADLNQVAGYDYGDNDSNPDDNSASAGHGTACAGVAAGIANNNLGVAGIAGGCSIMPLKVADSSGSMYFSAIDNAIYFAANNSADIASLSLGASLDPSAVPSTETAMQYAVNAGVTIFAATANDNASSIDYPSNSQYVISVGAAAPDDGRKRSSSSSGQVNPGVSTDPNGVSVDNEVWWGSNYGSTTQDARDAVDVIAPTILPTTDISGTSGYSTTDYSMWFNGTSCATPYAAGVAALIKSQNPTWTPAQVKAQLTGTAIDVVNVESSTGWDRYSGYGLVDAAAALYNPTVTVTSPNGGESWDLGTSHNITWTSQDITNIAIDLYNSGTYVYTIIGSYAASSGSMTWPIPTGLSASSSYSIRISDASASATYDDSDAYFTLSNPGSPNPVIDVTPLSFTATVEMDGSDTQQMHITNNGDPGSTLTYSLSHGFTDADNIAGSYVACSPGTFTPGETTNWTLSVYNASSDAEWLSDVYVTFPLGVTVNSGADFVGGSGGNLTYDGSTGNGATIHWTDVGGGWGNIYGGETATANINVTIHSGFIGDISLVYQIDGDVYGSTPHTVTGTAVVTQLITETWLSYTPTTGSCAQGITDDIDVTFDATGLTAGTYTADILVTNNGGGPVTVLCTLNVVFPPQIDVNPSSFSENLYTNQTATQTMTISNLGGEQLDLTLTEDPVVSWLSLERSSASILAFDDPVTIDVDFNTASLPHGDYTTDIVINSNDPNNPQIIIPVTLTVHNDPPTISLPVDFTYAEDGGLIVDFDAYVDDLDNDPLTLNVSGNTNISVDINELIVTFGNTQDWNGTEILMFTVSDGQADATAADMVDVIVNPVNDAPILNITGTFEADEDLTSITYDFSGFCSQTWGEMDILTLTADNSAHIDVTVTDFDVVFESNTLNWNGTEEVTFYLNDNISDSGRASTSQTIPVTINPVNDAPTIVLPSQFSVDEDVPTLFDFSSYINDVDGDILTITAYDNINISIDISDYDVTFGNVLNWYGTETITFTVSDGASDAMAADVVDVVIDPVNDLPILNIIGAFEADEDLPSVTYDFSGFCSQVWGEVDVLTLTADNSSHIDVTITDFDVVFESNTLNWNGTEDITFYLNDNVSDNGRAITNQTISVTIDPVNDAPTISLPAYFTVQEDVPQIEDFTPYIYDVDGDILAITPSGETNVTVNVTNYDVTFGNVLNWYGTESVTFTVGDGQYIAVDDIDVVIVPVNDAPILNITGTFEAEEDLPSVTYDFSGFCSQVWGEVDVLTLTADNSTHIDVTITDFDVVFESNTLDWNGTEDITIYLDDNVSADRDIVSQVIQVIINPVNDAPTIVLPDDFTFEEDGSLVEDFAPYIADVDPDNLTLSVVGNTEVVVDIVGTVVTFSSTENWFGTEMLTFTVNDNVTDATAEDDIDIIVTPVNDAPILNITGTFEAEEDLPSVTYDFSGFCSQVWGEVDVLTLTADNSTHIDVTITDFDVVFESNTLDWNGTEDITIYLDDNVSADRDIVSQVIQVTINPVNDAPTIVLPDDFTFEEDGSLVEDFAAYIADVDPDNLTLSVSGNTEIIADIVGTVVTFTPTENWFGTETLTFTVNDNVTDATAEDDIDIIVTPVNDEPQIISFSPEELEFTVIQDSIVTFTITAEDIDSDLTYEWLVNDELQTEITEEFVHQFIDEGNFEIKSIVSDEEYSLETIWDVTVDPATGSGEIIPTSTILYQNHPNPFNPTTNIRFAVTNAGNINISIYNIKGEQIKTLVNTSYPVGEHNVVWNGKDNNGKTVSSGVYFYHMLSKEYSGTKKMILMK